MKSPGYCFHSMNTLHIFFIETFRTPFPRYAIEAVSDKRDPCIEVLTSYRLPHAWK